MIPALLAALLIGAGALALLPTMPAHWRHLEQARAQLDEQSGRSNRGAEEEGGGNVGQPKKRAGGWWRRAVKEEGGPDPGMLALEVAALVRSGQQAQEAWQRALPARHASHAGRAERAQAQGSRLLPPALVEAITVANRPLAWWERWNEPKRAAKASQVVAMRSMGLACAASVALGAALAPVLESVADAVARAGEAAQERRIQLAAPMRTARLLRILPLAGLALGAVLGVDPVAVLLGSPGGWVCLAAGAALASAGNAWLTRIVRRAEASSTRVDLAVLIEVCASCLRAGASIPSVLMAVGQGLAEVAALGEELGGERRDERVHGGAYGRGAGRAGGREQDPGEYRSRERCARRAAGRSKARGAVPGVAQEPSRADEQVSKRRARGRKDVDPDGKLATELEQSARLLLLGAAWPQAWERIEEELSPLGRALELSWENGAAPEAMLARAAAAVLGGQSRRRRLAAAELGTKLLGPVAVCLLPAFVFLGVVPVVLGGAIGLLAT